MGKKITSIIVFAVALLLALPTQAQIRVEKSKVSGTSLKMRELKGAKQVKKTIALTSVKAPATALESIGDVKADALKKAAKEAKEFAALWEQNQKEAELVASRVGTVTRVMPQIVPIRANASGKPRKAEVVDENGVITEPAEGELKVYGRAGSSTYVSNQQVNITTQNGSIEVVETEDGEVYFKDFFYTASVGTWIKGTREGNTITVPANQVIAYWEDEGYGIRTGYVSNDATNKFAEVNAGEPYILTVDDEANTITLEGTGDFLNGDNFGAGLFYTDDNTFSGFSDYLSVFTYYPPVIVDELPYVNDFETAATQHQFSVIDANEDGRTWSFATASGNGVARYTYSSANDGDDYLISPAIKLEAGKNYRIALDAWSYSTSFPERVEVLIGTEPTVEALTETVIAPTDLLWNAAQTLENATVTVDADGYYYIAAHAISDADSYYLNIDNFVVEVGPAPTAPAAVADLTVTPLEGVLGATVAFTAPSKAINGSDLTALTKVEIYRDGEVIKTLEGVAPGSAQNYVDQAEDLTMGNHTYQVIAYNEAGFGAKSEEVVAFLSVVLNVPFTADLTSEKTFSIFQVIDNNNDGKTWKWSGDTYYQYSSANDGDDYLVSPAIHLEAGKSYLVTVNAYAKMSSFPERFEVVAGKDATAEALTIPVIAATDVANEEAEDFEGSFSVTETGDYHIAIHDISDADSYYLIVNSFSIEKGSEPTAPAAIADLAVAAGAEGALEATVSFTAPAKAVNGTDLTENLTKVEIYRDGVLVKEIENIAPGSSQNWTDTSIEESGIYSYQAIAFNASGNGLKSEKVSTFVGVDIPGEVENFLAEDQATAIQYTWDAVTEGENGGYVNPAKVEYVLWTVGWESFMGYTYPVLDEKIDSVFATNYLIDNVSLDEGEQTYEYWGLQPRNDVGTGSAVLTSLLVGAPYGLPIIEGFKGSSFHYIWDYPNLAPYISDDASDEDGVALKVMLDEDAEDYDGYFVSGKIDLSTAANPTLLFDLKTDAVSTLSISGSKDGGQFVTLKNDIEASATQYTTVKVPLNAIVGNRYSRVSFDFDFEENPEDSFLIDNIRIVDLYEYDLAADVKAAKSVTMGDNTTIVATVTNEGENAAENYTLIVKAGDKVLLNQQVTDALAPFKSREFRVNYAPTVFEEAGDIDITAEVVFDLDLNEDNNLAATTLTLKAPAVPTPENLQVAQADGKVTLTWDAPNTDTGEVPVEVTEGFDDAETFPEFSDGGLDEDNHTGKLGEWTIYDGNEGAESYVFDGITVPNLGANNAWIVFNPSSSQLSSDMTENYAPHSGTQLMISTCVDEPSSNIPATDHWLISPQLPGISQPISFFYRSITDQYGEETFEILYSTTNADPDSFQKLDEVSSDATEWTEYTNTLPAGAKYFAIRHTSQDIFGLLIDDVTFTSGGVSYGEVTSYNIYIDAEFDDAAEETTYEFDEDAVDGYHIFAVTAVYDDGTESKPATAAKKIVTDGIESIVAQGKPVNVYTVDGQYIGKVTTLKGMKKGVYVVNNKKVVLK